SLESPDHRVDSIVEDRQRMIPREIGAESRSVVTDADVRYDKKDIRNSIENGLGHVLVLAHRQVSLDFPPVVTLLHERTGANDALTVAASTVFFGLFLALPLFPGLS